MTQQAQAALAAMEEALQATRSDAMPAAALCARLREQSTALACLPPRYAEVLEQLADRLEAGALFTEESCSFSQRDLLDGLQAWIDKARARLAR
jgi:hypothetical protein